MKGVIDYFRCLMAFIPLLFQPVRLKAMMFYSNTFHVKRQLSRDRFIVKKNKWLINMEAQQKYNVMKHAIPLKSKVAYSPLTEEQKRGIVPSTKYDEQTQAANA